MPGFNITAGNPGPSAVAEVARSHRWEVTVLGGPGIASGNIKAGDFSSDLSFYAQAVTRPSMEFDTIKMHHRSNEINLPGKSRSGTCVITLYEKIDKQNVTAAGIRQWWSQWMMNAKNNALIMTNKSINSVKRQLKISQVDGCGIQMWAYILNGVFPTKITPSQFDYTASDLSTIEITLAVDAFQEGQVL
jgi:hypothetical protein